MEIQERKEEARQQTLLYSKGHSIASRARNISSLSTGNQQQGATSPISGIRDRFVVRATGFDQFASAVTLLLFTKLCQCLNENIDRLRLDIVRAWGQELWGQPLLFYFGQANKMLLLFFFFKTQDKTTRLYMVRNGFGLGTVFWHFICCLLFFATDKSKK